MTDTDFLNSIFETMPQGLSDLEKARYLYLKLGSHSAYNPSFYHGSNKEKGEIYNAGTQYFQGNTFYGICNDIDRCLVELYKMAGISAKIILKGNDYRNAFLKRIGIRHSNVEFIVDDKKYTVDITEDLMRIQMGNTTKNFASKNSSSETIISDEALREMDFNIGYISEDRLYVDENWGALSKALSSAKITNFQKVDFLFKYAKLATNFSSAGPVEKFNMCKNMFRNVLGPMRYKQIIAPVILVKNSDTGMQNTTLFWTRNDRHEIVYYCYDPVEDRYIQRNLEEMRQIVKENQYVLASGSSKVPKIFQR